MFRFCNLFAESFAAKAYKGFLKQAGSFCYGVLYDLQLKGMKPISSIVDLSIINSLFFFGLRQGRKLSA